MSIEKNYKIIRGLIEEEELSLELCFEIFKWISHVINVEGREHEGRDILLRLLDKRSTLPSQVKPILSDFLDKLGYFPYLSFENQEEVSTRVLLHYEFYRSENIPKIIMHQKQAEVYDSISCSQSIILSAPTSFGKSLLIEEIVASMQYNNIVIILPTLALIDEVRMKLMKYNSGYKLIFTSKQSFGERNIFILTPERFLEIVDIPHIDFFVIDEFYKLDITRGEDERVNVLNHTFYKLLKMTDKFYLLGPNISSIPEGFEQKYNCRFISSDFTTVSCDEFFIQRKRNVELNQLLELLGQLDEPTMIYCKSPGSAEKYVREILNKVQNDWETNNNHQDAIHWIKKNIHPEWTLNKALPFGVAFHHGSMPRHLGKYIVEEFNKGTIKYLFCTSTLIEGINTTAKNVVIFDNKKGTNNITFFDYRNIRGRAGRMTKHFVGKVYSFYEPPNDMNIEVDIPWYTQDNASDEILIQLEEDDLKPTSKERVLPFTEQTLLNVEVIKTNNNIPVKGQLALAELILSDLDYYNSILNWTSYPSYEQLRVSCNLIYDYLRYSRNRDEVYSGDQLAFFVSNYVRVQSNMARYIGFLEKRDRKVTSVDQAVQKATKLGRTWFEYRFPKLLLGLQQIQESIFKTNNLSYGDYKFYASLIEAGFCNPAVAALQEFGIPLSLLKKLESLIEIKEDEDIDNVITKIRALDIESIQLDAFENKLLQDFVNN
jgi:hypothetical protein